LSLALSATGRAWTLEPENHGVDVARDQALRSAVKTPLAGMKGLSTRPSPSASNATSLGLI